MINDKKNLIITVSDANFVKQAKQLFSSVYFNSGWEGDYMLLTHGLAQEDRDWFESKGIIVFDPPPFSDKPTGIGSYPPVLLSKFYFFQEYFKKWQKIIFLDADIIVKASLDSLLESDGLSAPMAITFRLRNEFVSDQDKIKEIKKKYDFRRLAFNSGVFVFDTDLIESDTFDNLLSFYERYKDIAQFGEESIFNLFFYKKWKLLPLIYNSTPDYMSRSFGIDKKSLIAIIIHFVCARVKPWNEKSPYYEEWSYNLKRADEIDLGSRPKAAKIYSGREIDHYARYLKTRKIACFLRPTFFFIDRIIGRVGLFIKKKNPELYRLIRLKKDDK